MSFAGMNLKAVNNLSAYLSSVIQKFENFEPKINNHVDPTSSTPTVRTPPPLSVQKNIPVTVGMVQKPVTRSADADTFSETLSADIYSGTTPLLQNQAMKMIQTGTAMQEDGGMVLPADLTAYTKYLLPANRHMGGYSGNYLGQA
jgi:hypothetical protein